jgi:Cu-Zn family superoxide dismutase
VAATSFLAFDGVPARAIGEKARADIKGRDGKELGTVQLHETGAGVLFKIQLKGLPAGVHGFHIYETGKCEGDFTSAGGIYNPLGSKHGFLHEEGPMVGDLPNLHIPASGDVIVELISPFVTLSKDAEDTLLDANGSALIIREQPDDYRTHPDGNSGARIACGVVTAKK